VLAKKPRIEEGGTKKISRFLENLKGRISKEGQKSNSARIRFLSAPAKRKNMLQENGKGRSA